MEKKNWEKMPLVEKKDKTLEKAKKMKFFTL